MWYFLKITICRNFEMEKLGDSETEPTEKRIGAKTEGSKKFFVHWEYSEYADQS